MTGDESNQRQCRKQIFLFRLKIIKKNRKKKEKRSTLDFHITGHFLPLKDYKMLGDEASQSMYLSDQLFSPLAKSEWCSLQGIQGAANNLRLSLVLE